MYILSLCRLGCPAKMCQIDHKTQHNGVLMRHTRTCTFTCTLVPVQRLVIKIGNHFNQTGDKVICTDIAWRGNGSCVLLLQVSVSLLELNILLPQQVEVLLKLGRLTCVCVCVCTLYMCVCVCVSACVYVCISTRVYALRLPCWVFTIKGRGGVWVGLHVAGQIKLHVHVLHTNKTSSGWQTKHTCMLAV